MSLCKYKNIFGEPGKGSHSYRIFGMAFVDLFFTFMISLLISWKYKKNIILVFTLFIVLSVIVHKMFCVETTLTKLIFN